LNFKHINKYYRIKSCFLVSIISILFASKVFSQCTPQVWCFNAGEELYYNIVYNWGFIWVDAGRVEFKTKKEIYDGRQVYHFSGAGTSLKKFDWFFKVNDHYNSYAEVSDLKPIMHTQNTSEDKYKVDNKYWFDYNKNKIYTNSWNSKKNRILDTFQLKPCIFDIMTAVYYARTLDLNSFQLNQKIPLTMIVDNEIYNLHGRYLGKETIKTKDKAKINCLKFSVLLVEGTMFKGGENLCVWVSDDANRVPILVEAKVLVGSVKAIFREAKNLKVTKTYMPDID
jgi:hypothetical protein